jgi:hypothetical protein
VNDLANSLAFPLSHLKKILMERSRLFPYLAHKGNTTRHGNKDKKTMKVTAIALVTVFALSGTSAFAQTERHMSHHRNAYDAYGSYGMDNEPTFHLRPNYGNPNGNADGPTTLSGTGNSQYGGSTPGTSGYN